MTIPTEHREALAGLVSTDCGGSCRRTHNISDERPRIVAILPRGESIRNFVYSGMLDSLSANADVKALSVIPSEEFRRFLTNQAYTVEPLPIIPERYPVRVLRELLDMAHGRHLWSQAAQCRWMERDAD